MHLYTHVREFGNLTQEARVALGYYKLILVPEVKHISQQIDSTRLMLDAVKEINKSALLSACVGNSTAAQMGVGEKIYGFHFALEYRVQITEYNFFLDYREQMIEC